MRRPQQHLANALAALKNLQDDGKVAIQSKDLSRPNRERLLKAGFITPIIKGWYFPARPEDTVTGESTSWYASFWEFCATYLVTKPSTMHQYPSTPLPTSTGSSLGTSRGALVYQAQPTVRTVFFRQNPFRPAW